MCSAVRTACTVSGISRNMFKNDVTVPKISPLNHVLILFSGLNFNSSFDISIVRLFAGFRPLRSAPNDIRSPYFTFIYVRLSEWIKLFDTSLKQNRTHCIIYYNKLLYINIIYYIRHTYSTFWKLPSASGIYMIHENKLVNIYTKQSSTHL